MGKVVQLRGDEASIDAGGQIVLHLNRVCVKDIPVHSVFSILISLLLEAWRSNIGMQDSHLAVNHAVEIIGRVQDDLSIKVLNSTDFGTDFGELNSALTINTSRRLTCVDFSAAESVVDATHRYREIFYGDD